VGQTFLFAVFAALQEAGRNVCSTVVRNAVSWKIDLLEKIGEICYLGEAVGVKASLAALPGMLTGNLPSPVDWSNA
jgi:hypothetical protein